MSVVEAQAATVGQRDSAVHSTAQAGKAGAAEDRSTRAWVAPLKMMPAGMKDEE